MEKQNSLDLLKILDRLESEMDIHKLEIQNSKIEVGKSKLIIEELDEAMIPFRFK